MTTMDTDTMTGTDAASTLVATLDAVAAVADTAPPLAEPEPDEPGDVEPDDEPPDEGADEPEPGDVPALDEPVDLRPTFADDMLTPIFTDVCADVRDDVPHVVAELHGTE